ncbi:MAG: hypothetical protein KatS3mg024_0966 [Armatimonadota bacterium]|nr:MAG: hypothetical protein KatS3mg024_0966 [Armatimonadota bacterium]
MVNNSERDPKHTAANMKARTVLYTGILACVVLIIARPFVKEVAKVEPYSDSIAPTYSAKGPLPATTRYDVTFNYIDTPVTLKVRDGSVDFMGIKRPAVGMTTIKKIKAYQPGSYDVEYVLNLYGDGTAIVQCAVLDKKLKKLDTLQVIFGVFSNFGISEDYTVDMKVAGGRLTAWYDVEPKDAEVDLDAPQPKQFTVCYQFEYKHNNGSQISAICDMTTGMNPFVLDRPSIKLYCQRNIPYQLVRFYETLDVKELVYK